MKGKYIASIDLGSLEMSLSIAQLRSGRLPRTLERVSRLVPVGVDTYRNRVISQAMCQQIITVLQSFRQKLDEYPDIEVRATSSSALREADNRFLILEQIKRRTGFDVEILSNNMENYYQILSAACLVPEFNKLCEEATLILNLGAGSIQLSLFDKGNFVYSQNILLGALRVRELLSDLEKHSPNFNALLAEFISGDLAYFRNFVPKKTSYKNLILSGISLSHYCSLAGIEAKGPVTLSVESFFALLGKLENTSSLELNFEHHIPAEHANLLLPGALIIAEMFRFTGVQEALIPGSGLQDGVLQDMAIRSGTAPLVREFETDSISAAKQLAARYKTDRKHCNRVEDIALQLFDQLKPLHALDEKSRRDLRMAAIMHNLGKYISMNDDDIRSYEIVRSAELIGIKLEELNFIATLIFYHNAHVENGGPLLDRLSKNELMRLYKLSCILALANSLDAGHRQKVERVSCKLSDKKLLITAYCNQDMTLEIWTFGRHTDLFEAVFGITPILKQRRSEVEHV